MAEKKPRTLLFCMMVMFFWMSMYTYQPQLTVYCGTLGAGAALTGTILSSYGLVQMLFRVPIGLLSDRLRKRKLFVILGALVSVLSAFGMYLAKTPGAMLVFRGLSGLSASAWVTYTVLFSSYFQGKEAPRAMSRIQMFNNSGTLLAMILGGAVAQRLGVRYTFLFGCAAGLVAMLLGLGVTENVPDEAKKVSGRELLAVAGDKMLLTVSCLALLGQLVQQGAVLGFTPKFAAELGATPSQLGLLSGAAIFGAFCASWLNNRFFLKRFGTRTCILAGLFLYGTATILLPVISKNATTVLAMQFIVGIGNGLSFPLLMGMAIAGIDQTKRGLAMGMFQSIYALGMFLGPLLTGILIEHISIGNSILCIGLVGLLEWVLGFLVLKK